MLSCNFEPRLEKLKNPREKISYISGNENPEKTSYIFSKESCSYISVNGNPEKILYISGKGTFLYFRKFFSDSFQAAFLTNISLIFHEATFQTRKVKRTDS